MKNKFYGKPSFWNTIKILTIFFSIIIFLLSGIWQVGDWIFNLIF